MKKLFAIMIILQLVGCTASIGPQPTTTTYVPDSSTTVTRTSY